MKANTDQLVVLWTSGDKEVAVNMVLIYTLSAKLKGWWEDICLLVWGPSTKLLSEDLELQEYIAKIKETGINIMPRKDCADNYGISEKLADLGIQALFTGLSLTQFMKEVARF